MSAWSGSSCCARRRPPHDRRPRRRDLDARSADDVRHRGGRAAGAADDAGGAGARAIGLLACRRRNGGLGAGRGDRGVDQRAGAAYGPAAVRRPVASGAPQRDFPERVRHRSRGARRAGRLRARRFESRPGAVILGATCGRFARCESEDGRPEAGAGRRLRARAQRQPQLAVREIGALSLVNFTTREITCKIVYYGPGRSGKTTNLHYIYGRVPESRRGRMVSLATQTDRTLFFDFLPIDLGQISGFTTRFQLYTVPGQVYYNATRRLVLQGADGVVFVADSQARQLDENLESLQNLQSNLLEHGVDIRTVPLVLQYNKQDLPRELILSASDLDDALNFRGVPSFSADALHGKGVFETLKGISELVLKKLAAGTTA